MSAIRSFGTATGLSAIGPEVAVQVLAELPVSKAPTMRCMINAANYSSCRLDLGESEHLSLTSPFNRQVVDARQELTIEVRGLAAVENGGGDVRREIG